MIQINPKFSISSESLKDEKWLPIKGYRGFYEVSNLGRVRSKERLVLNHLTGRYHPVGMILKQQINKYGYATVTLTIAKENKKARAYVHQLVASAFIGNPLLLHDINHKNENKGDNRVENLEYCDRKHNVNWGTTPRNKQYSMYKNTEIRFSDVIQYDLKMNEVAKYPNAGAASRKTGFNQGSISRCCRGERKTAFGYIWKYEKVNPKSRNIEQYDLDGHLVKRYISLAQAIVAIGRKNESIPNIIACCKGRTHTAYGYKWRYAD